MNISLAPETLFHIGDFAVTNTLFTSFVVAGIIILSITYYRLTAPKKLRTPSKLRLLTEMVVLGLRQLVVDIIGEEKTKSIFGFLLTFFIFIIVSNWFGLLPFVPSLAIQPNDHRSDHDMIVQASTELALEEPHNISHSETGCSDISHCYLTTSGLEEFEHGIHPFRAPTSDISFTLALAIISVIATNYLGFRYSRRGFLKKYIDFSSPIKAFVGFLEMVSELGKLVSFSFRLFGNVFAGEVLLLVITSISFGLATLPFLGLELFVGAIQALVFFMLTTVFIGLAAAHHDH